MKIGTPTPPATGGAESLRPPATNGKKLPDAPASEAAAGNETVAVSRLANLLAQGESAMESTPEIDSARVQELSQAIRDGRFRVDPERIAEGLLSEMRDLLSREG
ncbi:MAG: flagellar biosynthesis anti-sigma factor FlgM [Tepidiphilus sp.]|jgi:negative regulator of flagellin synthesis FlgM|nr:flagellar biosynthesis anti-sigma factor FlgM [Tepidiphilus sp.]